MAKRAHTGSTTIWGTRIPATDSNQYGILDLGGRRRPVRLGTDAANQPFPGTNDSRTAKELTRLGHVQCVFPNCGPYKTTAHSVERRDGFRHAPGQSDRHGRAGAETLDHLNSKAAILVWILDTYADYVADHVLDTKNIPANVEGRDASIRPDAYVELHSGVKIAVEFQHSAGDPDRVLAKHAAYARLGINTWWIFSGRSPFTCRNAEELNFARNWYRASLNSAQEHLVNRGIPFFWYDNEDSLIATPTISSRVPIRPDSNRESWDSKSPKTERRYRRYPFSGFRNPVLFHPEQLADCELDVATGDFITPTVKIHRAAQSHAAREVATLRQLAERRYFARQNLKVVKKRVALAAELQQAWGSLRENSLTDDGLKLEAPELEQEETAATVAPNTRTHTRSPKLELSSPYQPPRKQGVVHRIGRWFASLVQ